MLYLPITRKAIDLVLIFQVRASKKLLLKAPNDSRKSFWRSKTARPYDVFEDAALNFSNPEHCATCQNDSSSCGLTSPFQSKTSDMYLDDFSDDEKIEKESHKGIKVCPAHSSPEIVFDGARKLVEEFHWATDTVRVYLAHAMHLAREGQAQHAPVPVRVS
jgi:hypothetical protein